MKPLNIALVRQRYTAFGGAERFVERAMQALSDQGAQMTIVTRSWPGNGDNRALICNPFHLGNLWRDWSFARCVCRTLQDQHFDLVQSHERIACCDVFRAGDGVHREWLKQRQRTMGAIGRLGMAAFGCCWFDATAFGVEALGTPTFGNTCSATAGGGRTES